MERRVVFVTGATGRLGGPLVARLRERGLPCRALVRDPDRARLPAGVEVVRGDLAAPGSWAGALDGVGDVLHLAALTDDGPPSDAALAARLHRVVVEGTHALASAAARAGVRRLLLVSSAMVIGSRSGGPVRDDTPPRPDSAYGIAKLEAEDRAIAVGRERAMEVAVVRPVLVACPPSPRRDAIAVLVRLARHGVLPVPLGAGPCRKAVLGLDDAVAGILAARERARPGQRYLLAGPRTWALAEIADALAALLGRRTALRIPAALLLGAGGLASLAGRPLGRTLPLDNVRIRKYLADEQFDGARASVELGFTPRGTDLVALLRPCVAPVDGRP